VIVKDHFDDAEFKIFFEIIKTWKNKRTKKNNNNLVEI
jgi:hypothetical protein